MSPLPIDTFLPQIIAALRDRGTLVLVAEPGAGKTTRVPPAILDANLLASDAPNLVMLQPRRVAARASAARIADERGLQLGGDDVGYHVRFDKRVTDRTRLRVVTEGILTRQLVSDAFLEGVGCVVLDEFHERSLDVDLAIALLREVRSSVRPDLKIVVMSATLDAASVANFLADDRGPAPIVNVPGRTFPVEVEYRQPSERKVWERVAEEVERSLTLLPLSPSPGTPGEGRGEGPGAASNSKEDPHPSPLPGYRERGREASESVLVFLPGAFEIMRCQQSLESTADRHDVDIFPLHGSLSFEEQQRALQPSTRRKVILATNIAETSLTIDGVTHVIDTGLARVPKFDPKRGLDRLELTRISQASATQRAGRAGRTAPGRCVRLWTSREQAALDPFEAPEIRRVDLAPTVLSLRAWGTLDPRTFGWFDAPDEATLSNAENLLAMLGAIDGPRGAITALGKQLARLPVHPRIGRMLLAGVAWNEVELACTFAAILSEKDFVRDDDAWANRAPRTIGASDLAWRAQLLEGGAHESFVDRNGQRSVRRVREELLRVAKRIRIDQALTPALSQRERETIPLLLPLLGFPDRVCRRREGDNTLGTMVGRGVGGGGVRLHPSSVAREGAFFLALDARSDERSRTREAQVRIASRVEAEWLERFLPNDVRRERVVIYEPREGRVIARQRTTFGDLLLREATDAIRSEDDVAGVLREGLRAAFDAGEITSEGSAQLAARLAMVSQLLPPHLFPKDMDRTIDEAALFNAACDLAAAAREPTREGVIRKLDTAAAGALDYPLRKLLDDHAPESIEVPTGSQIKLDWTVADAGTERTNSFAGSPRGPVMAVRLQELFGTPTTPTVLGGAVKVVLHLLGPNYKPVQVTDDLASFWKNTYVQVRKDLRARYPKHSWPDDPLEAQAIRGPRKRADR